MRFMAGTLALLSAFLVSIGFNPTCCRAQALADRVPGDAVLYVGWKGVDTPGVNFDRSHFKAMLDASQFQRIIDNSLPKLVDRIALDDQEAARMMRVVMEIGGPMWHHPGALYFGGIDSSNRSMPLMPKLALFCDAGADAGNLNRQINDLLQQGGAGQLVHCTATGQMVVISTFDLAALPNASLNQNKEFQSSMSKLGKDPFLAAYVDGSALNSTVGQILDNLGDPNMKTLWPKVRDALGLTGLKSMTWTSGFDGKNWSDQAFVSAPLPRAGLLKGIGGQPLNDDLLKLVPASATMAGASSFDVGGLFTAIKQLAAQLAPDSAGQVDEVIKQVNETLGMDIQKDLLASFGPQWAYYVDPTRTGNGGSGITLVNHPNNAGQLDKSLGSLERFGNDLLKNQLDRKITVEFRQFAVGDSRVHYLATPMISPAWTIKNGIWYMGLYPQVVASAISRPAGDKSILENPAWAALRKQLGGPQKVDSFSFIDLPQTIPQGYQSWLMLTRLYPGIGDLFGMDLPPMLLPPMNQVLAETEPAGSISWTDDAGLHMKALEPFPGSVLLGSGDNLSAGIGPQLTVISILLPSLTRARETANRVKCASNMRTIGAIVMIYAAENKGKFPPDLATIVKTAQTNANIFVCPSSGHTPPPNLNPEDAAKWVNQNSDYVYVGGGLTQAADPTTIILYEKPDAHDGDGMNMLFADGHVEFMIKSEADRMIQEIKSKRGGGL